MMHIFLQPETWITLLVLTLLEIILGIDNIVFIILASQRLPIAQQRLARRTGLALAMILRLLLLGFIFWLSHLTKTLFHLGDFAVSMRDIVLIAGGLFLIYKAIEELLIFAKKIKNKEKQSVKKASLLLVLLQVGLLDIVFSLDSVITAVALANHYLVMGCAIIIAVIVMLLASEWLNRVINRYRRLKLLALIFILLVGIVLILHGLHIDFPNWYLYIILAVVAIVVWPAAALVSDNRQGR